MYILGCGTNIFIETFLSSVHETKPIELLSEILLVTKYMHSPEVAQTFFPLQSDRLEQCYLTYSYHCHYSSVSELRSVKVLFLIFPHIFCCCSHLGYFVANMYMLKTTETFSQTSSCSQTLFLFRSWFKTF